MNFIKVIICITIVLSCSNDENTILQIEKENYSKKEIEKKLLSIGKSVTPNEINNYVNNVLLASHLFLLESKSNSEYQELLKQTEQNIIDKTLYESILKDSVVNKSESITEMDYIKKLNSNKYNFQIFLFKSDKIVTPNKKMMRQLESYKFVNSVLKKYPNATSYEKSNVVFSEEVLQAVKECIYLNKKFHVIISNGFVTGVVQVLSKTKEINSLNLKSKKLLAIHRNFLKNRILTSVYEEHDVSYNKNTITTLFKKSEKTLLGLELLTVNSNKQYFLDTLDIKLLKNPKINSKRRIITSLIHPKLVKFKLGFIGKNYLNNPETLEAINDNKDKYLISLFNKKEIQNDFPYTVENSKEAFQKHLTTLSKSVLDKFRGRKLSLMMDFLKVKNNNHHVHKRDSILTELKVKYSDTFKVY